MELPKNNKKLTSSNSKSQNSFVEGVDHKQRYQIVIRQEKQVEREKAREKVENKKKEKQRIQKKELMNEIARKKQELSFLQKSQYQPPYIESQAEHKARVKMEKDRIKKMEKQLAVEINAQQAKNRHEKALLWLQRQKKILNFKKSEANNLRTTHCTIQKQERTKAVTFSKSLEQKKEEEKKKEREAEEKRIELFKSGLNIHGMNRRLPNSFSNPNILVSRQNQEVDEALKRLEVEHERVREAERRADKESKANRKKAIERGQQALERMKKQREYQDYCQEVSQEQVKYNMNRIVAGQKNQYAGVKPMTLSQMEGNKKLRGEEEFEKVFFKGKKLSNKAQVVTKYGIVENKMREEKQIKGEIKPKKKQPINYMEEESRIPGVSEGHYSFEEERKWTDRKEYHNQPEVKKAEAKDESEQQKAECFEPKPIIRESYFGEAKGNTMKQTRAPGFSRHRELNQSQQEDSNM